MKLPVITIFILLILGCESVEDALPLDIPEILYPDSNTVWQHWEYERAIAFSGLNIDSSSFYIHSITNPIYNPAYFEYGDFGGYDSNPPLQLSFQDDEHAILTRPVDSRWGVGEGFQIIAVSGSDTVYSQKFQLSTRPLPELDVAKILTPGTTYYYRQNTDGHFSWWHESIIGDTVINEMNYSNVNNVRFRQYQRADNTSLYYLSGDDEFEWFNLSEPGSYETGVEEMDVLGYTLPGISYSNYSYDDMGSSGTGISYSKIFGEVRHNTSNPQWMENSWQLVAILIDQVVYGDSTSSNYDIYP